jgi:hypothetical protein
MTVRNILLSAAIGAGELTNGPGPETRIELAPEEIITAAADNGVLTGMIGEMLKNQQITSRQAILELAKQKYGISDNGEELKDGGRDISMKTSIDIDEAVTQKFPGKQSVIDTIKAIATGENIAEGPKQTPAVPGKEDPAKESFNNIKRADLKRIYKEINGMNDSADAKQDSTEIYNKEQ